MKNIRALIAEDENILALTLNNMLQKLWPELEICAIAENGVDAVKDALTLQPDILFLDIQMPGKTGLEVAQELAEEWPQEKAFPLIVYVTAYDEFALNAFDQAVCDYVLKPVSQQRLEKTIQRLQAGLNTDRESELERVLVQLRSLSPASFNPQSTQFQQEHVQPPPEKLHMIRAAIGNQIRMIPVSEVIYFEATDKYINVVTAEHSSLIRMSLRELQSQIDSAIFWQIHRSTIVNSLYIHSAIRDESGKYTLKLREINDKLAVSRIYAHLFKQM